MSFQRMGSATHVGQREDNEDAICLFDLMLERRADQPMAVLAVADGMGGHAEGKTASHVAIAHVERFVAAGADPRDLPRVIAEANEDIRTRASQLGTRIGTTLTVAVVSPGVARIAHVGDSRAYLVGRGTVTQVTDDHSLVGELVRKGAITEAEAQRHEQGNVLRRALGMDGGVEADFYDVGIGAGDALVLCSDGLVSVVDATEIMHETTALASMEEAAVGLVSLAVERGGEDNISVVIWAYPGRSADVHQTIVRTKSATSRGNPGLEIVVQALVVVGTAFLALVIGYRLGSLL